MNPDNLKEGDIFQFMSGNICIYVGDDEYVYIVIVKGSYKLYGTRYNGLIYGNIRTITGNIKDYE